jgi:hypothetical protein
MANRFPLAWVLVHLACLLVFAACFLDHIGQFCVGVRVGPTVLA